MISVVMSVYNEPIEWLKESVESIVNQTYRELEFIIVIDNPNLDLETVNYLKEQENSDPRIRLSFNETNIGLAMSLNKGISIASGEFIARMDADDIAMPDRLEKELAFLKEEKADMVSTSAFVIDENSDVVRQMDKKRKDPSDDLPYSNYILHPSVLMRKNVVEELGGYRNFRRSQDYDLWLRMLSAKKTIRILDEPLMKYRINTNSLSSTNRLEQYYTNLYQAKLYRERVKKGFDRYSEEDFKRYIKKKRITKKKNQRCVRCMDNLNRAKKLKLDHKQSFLIFYIQSFFYFPSIVLRATFKNIRRRTHD